MPAGVIDRVHYIAQQQRTHPGLVFGDRNRMEPTDDSDEESEEDDDSYVPSEADGHYDHLNGGYDDNTNVHTPEDITEVNDISPVANDMHWKIRLKKFHPPKMDRLEMARGSYPRFVRAWEQRIHRQSNSATEEIAQQCLLPSYALRNAYPVPDRKDCVSLI
jgi:hypothetical protein